jgi:hypothetical protein
VTERSSTDQRDILPLSNLIIGNAGVTIVNPDDYVGRDGLLALHEECRVLAERQDATDLARLSYLMLTRADRTYEKHDIPRIVAAALATLPDGIIQLLQLLPKAPGHIYPLAIIETLWRIAQGFSVPRGILNVPYVPYNIKNSTRELAKERLGDLIAEAEREPALLELLVGMLQSERISLPGTSNENIFTRFFFDTIKESSIVLTARLVREFGGLIQDVVCEKDYQGFLERNPVFIDPLAAEVIPQKKLGNELVPDFVIRRHDYRYVVVEIEKPGDRIFTLKNDFTAQFTHAVGQVLDFQGWVADNIAYAQKTLPLIESPRGIVVIGRQSELSAQQQAKLRRWRTNSRAIEIVTYDEILQRADMLHRSLRRMSV